MRRVGRVSLCLAVWAGFFIASTSAQTSVSPGSPSASSTQLGSELERAHASVDRGDLPAAEKALRRALAIDPHSVVALNQLAIVMARQGKPTEAIPLYEEALKLRPGDPGVRRNLAIAHFKAQQYRSAWNLLEPLSISFPNDFQILDLAGLSLFALDRYPEAASYLERANQADPTDLETLDMLGRADLRMKDYKALPSVFERIMKINPNSASAHVMMGTAYDDMADRPNAIKEYQAAVAADPNFMGAHSGLGYLYWRAGDPDKAEKEMRAELEHYPNDPVANCILGQILFNSSQLEDARTHFEQALKANPKYQDALLGLGKTEVALNRPEAAIEPLRKAIQIDSNSAEAHFVLGTALRKSGHDEEGMREQKTSLEIQSRKNATGNSAHN